MHFFKERLQVIRELIAEGKFEMALGKAQRSIASGQNVQSELSKLIRDVNDFDASMKALTHWIQEAEGARKSGDNERMKTAVEDSIDSLNACEKHLADIRRSAHIVVKKEKDLEKKAA